MGGRVFINADGFILIENHLFLTCSVSFSCKHKHNLNMLPVNQCNFSRPLCTTLFSGSRLGFTKRCPPQYLWYFGEKTLFVCARSSSSPEKKGICDIRFEAAFGKYKHRIKWPPYNSKLEVFTHCIDTWDKRVHGERDIIFSSYFSYAWSQGFLNDHELCLDSCTFSGWIELLHAVVFGLYQLL